jgi:hypothetical protein
MFKIIKNNHNKYSKKTSIYILFYTNNCLPMVDRCKKKQVFICIYIYISTQINKCTYTNVLGLKIAREILVVMYTGAISSFSLGWSLLSINICAYTYLIYKDA